MEHIREVLMAFLNQEKSTALGEGRGVYDFEKTFVDFTDPDIRALYPDTITDYGLSPDGQICKITRIECKMSRPLTVAEPIEKIKGYWEKGKEHHEQWMNGRMTFWTDDRVFDFLMEMGDGKGSITAYDDLKPKIKHFRVRNFNG